MSVHLAPHLLVLLLLLPVHLVSCQSIHLPGIDEWKQAIQQLSQVEGRIEHSGEDKTGEENKREERVNTQKGLNKDNKAAILKLISKLSEEKPIKTKSKVETLLEEARVKKVNEKSREQSFLDKLLEKYSKEEREKALTSFDNDGIILQRLENKRRKEQKILKRRPLRRKNPIVILPRDYLVSGDYLATYDDYDDYVDYDEDVPLFNERVRSRYSRRLSSAEKSRRNIKRQLRKLLRSSS